MVRSFLAGLDEVLGIRKRALSPGELRRRIDGRMQRRSMFSCKENIDRHEKQWPRQPIVITPNLTEEAKRVLQAEAERQGITVAEVIRRAINGEREKMEGRR